MKKVYTVTFHDANNYGAVIQAYALQKVLAKKYDTKILNYKCKYILDSYKLFKFPKQKGKKIIIQFIKDIINFKKDLIRNIRFNNFRNEELLFTSKIIEENIKSSNILCDALVTGSDQVWNPTLTDGLDKIYTLNFNTNAKKIAYAASSGNNEALKGYEQELYNCIHNFNEISVREKKLQNLLSDKFNLNSNVVLDPSLLLDKNDWIKFGKKKRIISEKYILVYCGDEPDYFYDIVNELAAKTGYLIAYFGRRDSKNKFKHRKKSCYECGPKEFVNLIYNSEYVITASFHGTALASILNKNLIVVLNKYSDRLKTLLNTLKLEDCIVDENYNINNIISHDINWDEANKLLSIERNKSIKWLYDAIDEE